MWVCTNVLNLFCLGNPGRIYKAQKVVTDADMVKVDHGYGYDSEEDEHCIFHSPTHDCFDRDGAGIYRNPIDTDSDMESIDLEFAPVVEVITKEKKSDAAATLVEMRLKQKSARGIEGSIPEESTWLEPKAGFLSNRATRVEPKVNALSNESTRLLDHSNGESSRICCSDDDSDC